MTPNERFEELKRKRETLIRFQRNPFVHQLTCANDSKHPPLEPVICADDAKNPIHLRCSGCDYVQTWVPEVCYKMADMPNPLSEVVAHQLKEAADLKQRYERLWFHCNVLFFPLGGVGCGGDYPLEHNPHALKDSRGVIEAALNQVGDWVEVPCTAPACRGQGLGGPGFMGRVPKGQEAGALCTECIRRGLGPKLKSNNLPENPEAITQ